MRPSDDDGTVLDAEYHVEPEGQLLALVLESWSGGKAGSRPPRNRDYNRALTKLLTRLAQLDAVLVAALVDSRQTAALGLPETVRRIIGEPVQLSQHADLDALRRQMGTAQSKIGQSPDATKPGNSTKRIRLRLQVPGYGPSEAEKLAADLAVGSRMGSRGWPSADEVLQSLIGETIRTVTGSPNVVIAVQDRTALVGTNRSPQGQPVEISDVQHGMDKLRAHGTVRITAEELGHRSAFVGAVLATLPGVRATASPAMVTVDTISTLVRTDPGLGLSEPAGRSPAEAAFAALAEGQQRSLAQEYQRLCGRADIHWQGLDDKRTTKTSSVPMRYEAARDAVMLRSRGHCENPRCTGDIHDLTEAGKPILEVDHLHDLAKGGEDLPAQMIALCPNCHAIKTHGRSRHDLKKDLIAEARRRHDELYES